jgi:hypothetical protein
VSLASDSGEYIAAAGKATPPLAVSGVMVAGLSLQDWVLTATLVYTALQTALLIYNFIKRKRNGG